jgi:hypothetical protein
MVLSFLAHAQKSIEAMGNRDLSSAQESADAMSELYSWLQNADPPVIGKAVSDTFAELVRAGVPIQQAAIVLRTSTRGRGRPVANRLPVLLAFEKRELNPALSWSRLAREFCQCGQRVHDLRCRNRIRQQARALERVLSRLGV